jgi:hypothetical protein
MNLNVLTLFLVLLGALAAITVFFYGGALVLRWLEAPDSRQALANDAEQTAQKRRSASA